jgi:hypothetical protein
MISGVMDCAVSGEGMADNSFSHESRMGEEIREEPLTGLKAPQVLGALSGPD